MPKAVPPEIWIKYQRLRDEGYTRAEACRRTQIAESTASRYEAGNPKSSGMRVKQILESNSLPKVKTRQQLKKDALHCLDCFKCFRVRYFGRTSTPWQLMCADEIIRALASDEREYFVINCPPGSGKTTFVHDLLAWLACRDRSVRVMIGSRTENQARDHTRRLRNTFERTEPDMATSSEVAYGTRADANATLTAEYGRFKPERQDRWQEKSFAIATERDQAGSDKEVSFAAFGSDSAFLGGRYDVIVWDDLVDPKNLGTVEMREKLQGWYEDVAETRLEPRGLLLLVGQRMHAEDIYRWALDQKTLLFDDDGEILPDEEQEDAPAKYQHIVYKAHYEDKCAEGSHKLNAPAWPAGCLLDPKRLSWRFLAPKMKNNAENFARVYQQEDSSPVNALVLKEWVEGGKGENGEYHPGCKDKDRGLLEIPENLEGKHLRIVSVDPSVERFWSIQDWLVGEKTKYRYLINLLNAQMTAPDLLGWNMQSRVFYGVLEEWWQISKKQGRPIQFVIVEAVAAHKYLLQYDHVREWQRQRQVRILGHDTHRNKSDAKYGVQSLGPVWRDGLVRLPWGNAEGQHVSMRLIHEVTRWSPGASMRDDNLMAQWFLEWQLATNALFAPKDLTLPTRAVPAWVGGPVGRIA